MSFRNSIVGGIGALIRAFIRSPNYVTGVSGWTINRDGSAEFNNLTIRGTFQGTQFIINSLGAFFYSGTPALGNLIASITGAAGANDGLGNAFKKGITSYGTGGSFLHFQDNQIDIGSNAADTGGNIHGGGGQINYASGISTGGDTNAALVLISQFLTLGGNNPQVLVGPTATPSSLTSEMFEVQGRQSLSDASVPTRVSGTSMLYSATGRLAQPNFNSVEQILRSGRKASTTTHTATNATPVDLTDAWVIPGTECTVNSIYEIAAYGQGTWGSTPQLLTFSIQIGGNTVSVTIPAGTFNASQGFNWNATVTAVCKATGASGDFRCTLRGCIAETAGALQPGVAAHNTVPFVRSNSAAMTSDTTSNVSFTIQSAWGSVVGVSTITSQANFYERVA